MARHSRSQRPASTGAKRLPVSKPEPGDAEIFRRAMEALDEVPDKDRLAVEPKPHRVVKRKPSKKLLRPPDDHLDLHGKTVEQARAQLQSFVKRSSREGHRLVRVVTGKGFRSPTGVGVLKQELERWVRAEGQGFLEAYSEAPRTLGGSGAYLLYLR